MATYLVTVNNVLRELNEPTITTVGTTSGIQTAVKGFVDKAIRDINNAELEWSFNHAEGTQTTEVGQREYKYPSSAVSIDYDNVLLKPTELVTNGEFTSDISSWTTIAGSGSGAYNSGGNGRLRLNDYAAYQAISTVVNKTYRLQVRALDSHGTGQALKVQVGTAAEGTQNLNTTLTVTDYNAGKILDTTFSATKQTTYITLNNPSTATNMDIDYVRISEDIGLTKLKYLSYEEYKDTYATTDEANNSDVYGKPSKIYKVPKVSSELEYFGVSPVPDKNNYTLSFDYWTFPSDLSSDSDTPGMPARFHDLVVARAKYYAHVMRSDPTAAQIALAEYEKGLQKMRTDLINKPDYMRGV
jgi:hypothetical protein